MQERPEPSDNFFEQASETNKLLQIDGVGLRPIDQLPGQLDLTHVWQSIAALEADQGKCPPGIEIFWGVDLINHSLVCTEIELGDELTVTPKGKHFVYIHSEPWRKGWIRERRPGLSPNEIVDFLNDPNRYLHLVFTRGKNNRYPCCLVVKTIEATTVNYDINQAWIDLQMIQFFAGGSRPWKRENTMMRMADRIALKKKVAIYRGIIDQKFVKQHPLLRVVDRDLTR